ncbi:MAG: hypothetical protein ACI9E1_000142 [Cryomorphaceae bacterium]|jgi:hypothetical protein
MLSLIRGVYHYNDVANLGSAKMIPLINESGGFIF